MFNFNHNQGAGNNRCGGYSLAAIATMLQPNVNHDPQTVYNILRGRQVGLGQNSRNLVAGTQQGGTDMLLPSTFLAAQYAQLNYELNMNQGTFVQQALFPNNIIVNDIITEKRTKINNLGANLNQLIAGINLQIFLNNDAVANNHQYWLVLVLGGRHWVAIERDPNNGQYCIYNPAGGINAVANIAGDVITYTDNNNNVHIDRWTGIAISVA